jgi:hypothetical protein
VPSTLRRSIVAVVAACASLAHAVVPVPPAVAGRLAALDCNALSASDVADVLAKAPAPRIIALHGSVPIVTMEPFAEFLARMGYPDDRLVNPVDGSRTHASRIDSRRLAGHLAWHYERDGLMPLLVGHSQGGMVVIKLLHDLAGTRDAAPIAVWDPGSGEPEARTHIVDPLTGERRAVNDLTLPFAAALATGSLPRLILGQWGILPLLRDVPDSVDRFIGFSIPWDPIAGTFADPPPFRATGRAKVRNVVLPASYSHIDLPRTAHLASQPATRAWIDAYRPGEPAPPPEGVDVANLVHAAELWHAIRRQWCEGAKRLAAVR